ncbi:MAG: cysteine hydrolase family protein [Candidatus Sifarchaeia archaeon]
MKTALLVIDMQLGNFIGDDPIVDADSLLNQVSKLIEKARDAGTQIIYIQNSGDSGSPDEYGTSGWNIHPDIAPEKHDLVIEKKTPDSFHETKLKDELDSRKIKRLVITGLQTEYCIDTTCRSAFSKGHEVVLVKDAHGTWNSVLTATQIINHHNELLGSWFAKLSTVEDLLF